MMVKYYEIIPCSKPRMTKRDKWKKRPVVLKYFAFRDECRLKGVQVPEAGAHVIFHVPMPLSWTKKKRNDLFMKPHRQKPDIDNLVKGLLDAVYDDDSTVHDIRASKVWSKLGGISVATGGNADEL